MKYEKYIYHRKNRRWRSLANTYGSQAKNEQVLSWTTMEDFEDQMTLIAWYCGVEVHKKSIVWALYGIKDEVRIEGPVFQCSNNLMEILEFLEILVDFTPKRFLMETTGIFHFNVAWELMGGFPKADVAVMNARLIHRYITGVRKNDRSDAQKLAIISRYDELVRYSYVPSRQKAILRELTRMRENYVKEATKIKNRITP